MKSQYIQVRTVVTYPVEDRPKRLNDYIEYIRQVKSGYDEVATSYREQKNDY